MRFINNSESASFVQIFDKAFYQGDYSCLKRGDYNGSDFPLIASVKVADFTRVALYEKADGNGKVFIIDRDCAEVKISFTAQTLRVETYAKGICDGIVYQLAEGEYAMDDFAHLEKIIAPKGFYVVLTANKEDKHRVKIFENEEFVVDAAAPYEKALLFTLGQDDARIDLGIKEELTDDDLLAVAGGKKCNKCDIHAIGCEKFVSRDF